MKTPTVIVIVSVVKIANAVKTVIAAALLKRVNAKIVLVKHGKIKSAPTVSSERFLCIKQPNALAYKAIFSPPAKKFRLLAILLLL